ncbi:MAG: phage tail tape measure protein [Phycisphaeraceae bacterium]
MEKRIDIFFKGHNQVSPAARAAASEAEDYGRKIEAQQRRRIEQFKALDAAQRQSNQQQARRRSQIQDTLGKSQVENLRREVALGREGAKIDLQRLQITRQYEAERKQLARITRDELATSKQKIAAERQLVALQAQHNRQLDRLTARRLFGDPAGGIATKNRQLAQQNTLATRAAGSVTRLVGAYLGFSAVSMAVRSTTRAIMEHVDGVVRLQGELKDLIALGNNAGNQGAIREQVLGLSSSTGRSTQDIADLLFNVQSGSGGLTQSIQDQILSQTLMAGEATSAQLNDVATALIKSYGIFGQEVKGVTDLQNRLFFSAERGIITYGELSKLLPRVLPAAEAFNFSLNETLATLSLGTRIGGKNEETFTAIRNVFLRMNNATKEGIELTGSLADRMEQLSQVDPETLKKIFGDEAVTLVLSLTKNVEALRKEVGLFDQIPDGLLEKKLSVNLRDEVAAFSRMMESARQGIENVKANPENAQGAAGEFAFRKRLAEANLRREMGVFGSIGFGGGMDLANLMASAEAAGFSSRPNENVAKELERQFEAALKINNFPLAEALARKLSEFGPRAFIGPELRRIERAKQGVTLDGRLASLGMLADPEALRKRFEQDADPETLDQIASRYNSIGRLHSRGQDAAGLNRLLDDLEKRFAPILASERERTGQQRAEQERQAAAQARRDRLAPLLRDQQFKLDIATQQAAGNTLGAAMLRIEQQYAAELTKNANDPELLTLIEKRKKLEQKQAIDAEQQRLRDEGLQLQSLQNQVKVQRLASGGKNAEAEIERLRFSFYQKRLASPEEHTAALMQLEASAIAGVKENEARRLEDLEIQIKRQQLLAAGDRLGAELMMIEKEFARRIEDAAGPGEVALLEKLKYLQIQSAQRAQRGQDVLSNNTPGALGVDLFFSGAAERFRINGNDPASITAAQAKRAADTLERMEQKNDRHRQKLDQDSFGRLNIADTEQFIDLA